MQEDYNYIKGMIDSAVTDYHLDLCRNVTENFYAMYHKQPLFADLYQNLLGWILLKYKP